MILRFNNGNKQYQAYFKMHKLIDNYKEWDINGILIEDDFCND